MYTNDDAQRVLETNEQDYRTAYRRDYARLIHSPSFRRLQGKTQLYPGIESDFFRNRLTHSLEVAQISKTIGNFINNNFLSDNEKEPINLDICEFAGVAHDLGHPPFGHQGEEALDECMRDNGGFEGNAQTLRILSKLEKKEKSEILGNDSEFRFGLNLTYRSLASILKYDNEIPVKYNDRKDSEKNKAIKGYYSLERDLVETIKEKVVGEKFEGIFKTVECQIMDIADDIAYSTYDLEDGFKAGFYHPTAFFSYPENVFVNVAQKVEKALKKDENIKKKTFSPDEVKEILLTVFSNVYNYESIGLQLAEDEKGNHYIAIPKGVTQEAMLSNIVNTVSRGSKSVAEDGYIRNAFTSDLINGAINDVKFILNEKHPSLSKVFLEESSRIRVEVLKNFTYESQILSPRLKIAEFRGKEIVKEIFKVLSQDEGWRLMPSDYQTIHNHFKSKANKLRCICDYISGMTDKYAIEFYGRLKSENPETIFKPF
ncbi:dNTP triphosphohydrolase [Chryseobacterium sp. SN22]|uniref:dGTP triphosphohydrolase n=1 Tax=Chryseobacterium sp. SN22 TaxID=2606431 RepID=UPI0011EE4AD8|nr:dNTP triphosphohydrolase [Chryseobacterium sp. SN22]KAA0127309.1 dNTP triphosphohydrolase [Chryseobacterium sp. SN22]